MPFEFDREFPRRKTLQQTSGKSKYQQSMEPETKIMKIIEVGANLFLFKFDQVDERAVTGLQRGQWNFDNKLLSEWEKGIDFGFFGNAIINPHEVFRG